MENEMKKRAASPFDDSVEERHCRMGLLTENRAANMQAVEVISRVHAGLFFDHVCDVCDSYHEVVAIMNVFFERGKTAKPKEMLLLLSMQYDLMQRPLPEVIWWLSGSKKLLTPFVDNFVSCLKEIVEKSEGASACAT